MQMFDKITDFLRNFQFKIILQLILFLFIALFIHISSTASQAEDAVEPASEIQYTDTGSDELIGYIYSKPRGGVICNKCLAVELKIDGNDIPAEIKTVEVGKSKIVSRYSGLEDGPHTVTKKLMDKEGNVLSSNQIIFLVDTKPPILELVEPSEDTLLPGQKSFLVKFSDEGSGIPSIVEEMKVEANVNGVKAHINVSEKEDIRMLIIDDTKGVWEYGEEVNLYINTEDRAGNKAELNKKFHVREEKEERENEPVECSKDGEITISQMAHTIKVPWPEVDINSIYYKKDKKEHKIEFYLSTSLGYPVKNSILDQFKITSNHPAVSIQRLDTPEDSQEIRYIVSQSESVTSDESLGSITIAHPKKIIHKFENSCKNGNPFSKFIEMESSSDVITYSVPVSLFWHEEFHDEVAIEEDRFKYKVFFDKPGMLDIAASRFEIEDRPYWFKDVQEYYEIDLPAHEGLQTYKAVLTLFSGTWQNTTDGELSKNKTCLTKNKTFFVKLEPPVIENFFYNHGDERFWAVIQDKGTELKDLNIRLNVTGESGIRDVQIDFNLASGAMEADYPLPTGIESASLAVTDKAGQTTHVTCDVFGKPAEPEQGSGEENDYPVIYKKNISVNQKIVSPRPGEYYFYLGPAPNGQHKFMKCISKSISDVAYLGCINSYLAQGMAFAEAIYFCNKANDVFLNDISTSCREILLDAMPPYIWDFCYNTASSLVTARISDHGMPLSGLDIIFSASSAYPSTVRSRANPPFSFNTTTGSFSGKFAMPSKGELYNLVIIATDRAGHSARASVNITAPRKPPDVSLRVIDMEGQRYYFSGTQAKVYLSGQCCDESGINRDKTRLWIDDHPLQPLSINRGWSEHTDWGYETEEFLFCANLEEGQHTARFLAFDNAGLSAEDTVVFNVSFSPVIRDFKAHPTSLQLAGGPAFSAVITDQGKDLKKEGMLLEIDGTPVSSDRLYYDPSSGYFAADGPFDFTGGRHQARVIATDDHGNHSEKHLSFVPGEKVIIAGNDTKELNVDSFTLWEIENHNGDGKANPGELVRAFITLRNTGDYSLNGITARLASEESLITVEKDNVDYKSINAKDAPLPVDGFDLRISREIFNTTSSHPFNARLNLEVTDDSGSKWSFPFTLPVYRATIPAAGFVTVEINPLPRNTEQTQIEIKGKATSTASGIDRVAVYVNGHQYNARWDYSESRFSASVNLVAGSNVIEVQATDKSGNLGSKTVFIARSSEYVPPEVTITFPVNGTSYPACSHFIMTGTFSTGSSGLASLSAVFIAGGSGAIPLVINGNSFESTVEVSRYPDGGNITIGVTLTTTQGNEASDTASYYVGPCF